MCVWMPVCAKCVRKLTVPHLSFIFAASIRFNEAQFYLKSNRKANCSECVCAVGVCVLSAYVYIFQFIEVLSAIDFYVAFDSFRFIYYLFDLFIFIFFLHMPRPHCYCAPLSRQAKASSCPFFRRATPGRSPGLLQHTSKLLIRHVGRRCALLLIQAVCVCVCLVVSVYAVFVGSRLDQLLLLSNLDVSEPKVKHREEAKTEKSNLGYCHSHCHWPCCVRVCVLHNEVKAMPQNF